MYYCDEDYCTGISDGIPRLKENFEIILGKNAKMGPKNIKLEIIQCVFGQRAKKKENS